MRSLVNRQFDDLAKFGIRIHRPNEWQVALDTRWRQRRYHPRLPVRFHTTQDRVWLDGVAEKKDRILDGWAPYVTVVNANEIGDIDLWVCNGHHTLAAYLDMGRTPYLRWFERASMSAGCPVAVPKFDSRAMR